MQRYAFGLIGRFSSSPAFTTRGLIAMSGLAAGIAVGPAAAQLTPDRTYYPINRAAPMRVEIPREVAESGGGEPIIELFTWGATQPGSSAHVVKGGVDLASLFPELWTASRPQVQYAQLRVGDKKVGAPVVLQPMVAQPKAQLFNPETRQAWFVDPKTGQANYDARKCELSFTSPKASYSGVRAYVEQHVVFATSMGDIEFRMRPDQAPNTVNNLLDLVKGGFFQEILVHRIVPKLPTSGHPFVIQFGDPTGGSDGADGGPGFSIDLENTKLPHDFGVLSMARDDDPDTNGSQVFICLSREGTARLDGKYCAFAQAVSGAEVILEMGKVKTDEKTQRPLDPPVVHSAKLVPAPPFGTGPAPVKRGEDMGR